MNFKTCRRQSRSWREKANIHWWTSFGCVSLSFLLLILLSSDICTTHTHTNQRNQRHHTFDLLLWNSCIWVRCFSWHYSERGNEDQEKKEWWILGEGQMEPLSLSLCPRLFSLGELDLKHIMGCSLEFLHSKHLHSKQLHLCWHNSKSIWYTIQLGRECRIFSRRKITLSNGSLFLIFLKWNQWIRLNLPPKCSRGSTILWLNNATGFHIEIVLMLPCRNRFKYNEQS